MAKLFVKFNTVIACTVCSVLQIGGLDEGVALYYICVSTDVTDRQYS